MRESRRVLKPGGVFRGQFNGLPHSVIPDTWSGVVFSADDIRNFTRETGLQLLALEGIQTQYMRTTWRKFVSGPALPAPFIKGITNAHSYEPVAPKSERHAAISIWVANLPEECDLNNLEVVVEGVAADPFYVGWPIAEGVRQVNAWLPEGIRTGLLPVEIRMNGRAICAPGTVRIIPAGPMVPRIISVTDGVNLVEKNASDQRPGKDPAGRSQLARIAQRHYRRPTRGLAGDQVRRSQGSTPRSKSGIAGRPHPRPPPARSPHRALATPGRNRVSAQRIVTCCTAYR